MDVMVHRDVACPMRDGTTLRADVYRPADDGRYPVVLLRTPYSKEQWQVTHLLADPIRTASAGYVVVLQDVRCRWKSEGATFEPYLHEFDDGHDTVEWAARLPFASGVVGAQGVSYLGAAAWHAAVTRPPSLRAIIAATAPNDQFVNLTWRGGAFLWGTQLMWSLRSIGLASLVRDRAGSPDFLSDLTGAVAALDAFDDAARHLPPRALPAARPDDSFIPFFFEAMDHSTRDQHHRARSTAGRHADVEVPALIIAGWHDLLLGADLEHFSAMRTQGANEAARTHSKLIVGPWSHGAFTDVVGEVGFGQRASGLSLDLREDLTALTLRWFDQRLKGVDSGIDDEPPVRLFVQGSNRWRDEDEWPLARAKATRWYLASGGRLSQEPPAAEEPPDAYAYDPLDPCPTTGGTLLLPRTYPAGPVEQSPILQRRDVLTYRSEPLPRDLEVTGPVSAILYAATSAPDTDWVVKLCDVHPDGRAYNVCDGILRARYRHSWEAPTMVEPQRVERYEIDLWATSTVFKAGHRLLVVVTSSDFPRYDRNPNTGVLGVDATATVPALQRIFHDAERRSHLVLPHVP